MGISTATAPLFRLRIATSTADGAQLSGKSVDTGALDPSYSASAGYGEYLVIESTQVLGIGTTCDDASCTDLIMYIRFLDEEVCKAISDKFYGTRDLYTANAGSSSKHGNYTADGSYQYYAFSDNGKIGSGAADEVNLIGKPTGCFYHTGADKDFTFYHVLLAR